MVESQKHCAKWKTPDSEGSVTWHSGKGKAVRARSCQELWLGERLPRKVAGAVLGEDAVDCGMGI